MDFPVGCRPLPDGRFRLKPRRSVAASDTRLPLSPHCNPLSALCVKVSLGDFHNITRRFYPLLQAWFQEAISPSAAATAGNASLLYPRMSTQGRLHCTQHTILCTALQVHLLFRTQSGLRRKCYWTAVAQEQVSTEIGSVGICHYTSPENLNPQHPP